MKFTLKFLSLMTIVSLFPMPVQAVTNQEIVEDALNRLDTEGSIMHMQARVRVSERDLSGREESNGDVAFEVKTKTRPTTDPLITDSDGRFTLSAFHLTSNELAPLGTFELDAPFVIEWVNRHPMRYIRLQQIPESVANFFTVFGVNILGIQKTWIGFDWEENTLGEALTLNESFSGINSILDVTDTDGVEESSLLVGDVERIFRNAKGESITRYRAKMNPAYIQAMYQNRVENAVTDFDRTMAETERAEQMKLADSLGFAINYNTHTLRIERIEMGGKITEPRNDCHYVGAENVCAITGTTVTSYAVGITYFTDDLRPIYHPPGWRWLNDIADRLEISAEYLNDTFVKLVNDVIWD